MSEMVERVALAILRQDVKSSQADHPDLSYESVYDLAYMLFERHHIPMAKAAIEAMREPTEAMVTQFEASDEYPFVAIWVRMIDEALK